MIATNKDERYKELNSYIQQKKQQSLLQNPPLQMKRFEQYVNHQTQILDEWKKLNSQSLNELLQYIIEDDFYYLNKSLHIVNLNEKNAKILNLLTEIPEEDKRKGIDNSKQIIRLFIQAPTIIYTCFFLKDLHVLRSLRCSPYKIYMQKYIALQIRLPLLTYAYEKQKYQSLRNTHCKKSLSGVYILLINLSNQLERRKRMRMLMEPQLSQFYELKDLPQIKKKMINFMMQWQGTDSVKIQIACEKLQKTVKKQQRKEVMNFGTGV